MISKKRKQEIKSIFINHRVSKLDKELENILSCNFIYKSFYKLFRTLILSNCKKNLYRLSIEDSYWNGFYDIFYRFFIKYEASNKDLDYVIKKSTLHAISELDAELKQKEDTERMIKYYNLEKSILETRKEILELKKHYTVN